MKYAEIEKKQFLFKINFEEFFCSVRVFSKRYLPTNRWHPAILVCWPVVERAELRSDTRANEGKYTFDAVNFQLQTKINFIQL